MTPYIDFEIIKEPWNKYSVADGSTLKTRIVMEKILRDTQGRSTSYDISARQLLVVYPESRFRGSPSARHWTLEEQVRAIEQEDIRIDTMAQEFNEYVLDDGTKIRMHTNITRVSRTSLHNSKGDRIYVVEAKQLVDIKRSGETGSH